MVKVTWNMNSGKTYQSTMEAESWDDVAQFLCDNPDFIAIHDKGKEIILSTHNISDFTVEAA